MTVLFVSFVEGNEKYLLYTLGNREGSNTGKQPKCGYLLFE